MTHNKVLFNICIRLWQLSTQVSRTYSQDERTHWQYKTVDQVFYLLSFNLYKYDITFFSLAQIIDNSFTVSTSAVMWIYRQKGGVRVATVWPTQTAHFATVDRRENATMRERPHCTLRKSNGLPIRNVVPGTVKVYQWRFLKFGLQRAKDSLRESTSSLGFHWLKAVVSTVWMHRRVMWPLSVTPQQVQVRLMAKGRL